MPDFSDDGFMGRFNALSGKIDPQEIMAIVQEVVPPAMVGDVLAIVLDPKVQEGLASVQEAIANVQEIGFDLFESLPTLVQEIRNSYNAAVDGAREGIGAIDTNRIAALKSYAPQVATGLAKVALSRPEAQPLRERAAEVALAAFGKPYGGQPGAATVAIALQAIQLQDMDRSAYGKAAAGIQTAIDLIVPEPIVAATRSTIEAFAKARGVDFEDELGRWQRDAGSKTLLTGAANRYAKATGLDQLPDAERLAATANIVIALGKLFEGVTGDWVKTGSSPATVGRAERNARTAFRSIANATAAKVKAPEATAPEAPKRGRGKGGIA